MERAPWWAGFFERIVQSVNRCLKKVLKNARVTTEELQAVLVEVEATLNARPRTFVSSEELEEPLTPFHLMRGSVCVSCQTKVKKLISVKLMLKIFEGEQPVLISGGGGGTNTFWNYGIPTQSEQTSPKVRWLEWETW